MACNKTACHAYRYILMAGGRLHAQTTSVTTESRGALHLKRCIHEAKWAITAAAPNLCNLRISCTAQEKKNNKTIK
eukprot:scaffold411243_cov19-Prasinocladus_malaysianus.AAC.1